ncbi:MAG: hypothetical protein K2O95_00310 [Clostridia bacterium]|nr:hypothetical protein [Clostridia bacterium]MDE6757789.1 hypothetical protein [Clostridia bacterium]MDE7078543.1 hypothetical protein [Clostridia bacterium]
MNFSKKQKVAIIFSMWLFFLWIVAISLIMRVDFKGDLYDCIKISVIGMLLAVFFYALIFSDKYFVAKYMSEQEDRKKIKSMKRTAYIRLTYIDIVGFFLMTLSALLVDSNKVKVVPSGMIAVLTVLALFVTVIIETKKIRNASRTLILQEQNKDICGVQKTAE